MLIRQITMRRFRRFAEFTWEPAPGINCLIGPGDGGKSTILSAIAFATSPSPFGPAAEHDYYRRATEQGFEVALILGGLDEALKGLFRPPALWGWAGANAPLRSAPTDGSEPVLQIVVRGTPDLELEHRVLSPDGEELFFSVDRRRRLGLCRIGDAAGTAREFRLARGSLLERTLGREEMRGAAASAVREASRQLAVPTEVEARIRELAQRLREDGLSADALALELLSPPGQSLLGLLGLATGAKGEAIPLGQAGQGTQRLASFSLARALAQDPPLVVIDELENGLEPYRRRLLIQRLRAMLSTGGQAFITTHSSTVLSELRAEEIHRISWQLEDPSVEAGGPATVPRRFLPTVTRLSDGLFAAQRASAEALLCRLPVVCEGQTEVLVLGRLLQQTAAARGLALSALGVHLVDGGGQPQAFDVIDGFCDAGFDVAMFLDEEERHVGHRKERAHRPAVSAGTWTQASCTELALSRGLTLAEMGLLLDIGDETVDRLAERRLQQLQETLGLRGQRTWEELCTEVEEAELRAAWGHTAHKPGNKAGWFKSLPHASALADWLADHGLPADMRRALDLFWEKISLTVLHSADLPADADQQS
jgi:putative ATP-dependent endonuclease of OLD family